MINVQIDKKVGSLMAISLVIGLIVGGAIGALAGHHGRGGFDGRAGMMGRQDARGGWGRMMPAQQAQPVPTQGAAQADTAPAVTPTAK